MQPFFYLYPLPSYICIRPSFSNNNSSDLAIKLLLRTDMGLPSPLLFSLFMFVLVGTNQAAIEPKEYWDKVLPHTLMPSAIEKLLPGVNVDVQAAATSVNVGKGGVNVHTGKGTAVNVGKGGVGVNTGKTKPGGTSVNAGKGGVGVNTGKGTSVNVGKGGVGVRTGPKGKPVGVHVNPIGSPFDYNYAASDTQLHDDPAATLFFLRNDLRPGKQFTIQLAAGNAASATFIPRQKANTIPFTTSKFPSILSHFSILPNSDEAATMRNTLQECEATPAAGETKLCATSLEAMVDFTTTTLGTRDVVAVATEGGGASAAERRPYNIKTVRRVAVAGKKGVVVCHKEAYAYAVFFCHATTTADVYVVELEAAAAGGATSAKAVAVCHTETAAWNPKHLAFKVLGVKPGSAAVCHFLPRDHVVWAEKL